MQLQHSARFLLLATAAAVTACGSEPTAPGSPRALASVAASALPTTINLTVTPSSLVYDCKNVTGTLADAAPGYSLGSLASTGGAATTCAGGGSSNKTDIYFTPAALFGRDVNLGEVTTISYWTKTGATHAADPRDWFLAIYTKPYAGDQSTPTWYGDRIGSEPYFSAGLTDPANAWNQWSTNGATNTLRFFESTAGATGASFGSYTDPDWTSFVGGNALSGDPYAGHAVLFFSLQTGSGWATGFTGQLDGFRITLSDNSVATVNFEPDPNWGSCQVNITGTTYILLANCITSQTLLIPAGYTIDGNGFSITAVDPAGGHFLGAVVRNGGSSATVIDLTVTASGLADVCDGGNDRLRGILFDGAGGSISNSTITGVRQGLSGCQEGNGIEVRNLDANAVKLAVSITGNLVNNYQKNGITTNGNLAATISGNTVVGDGSINYTAQNGIQIAYGASAILRGNSASGNAYAPASYVACGVLFYQAGGVKASANTLFANERDNCNYGKGGGNFNPNP